MTAGRVAITGTLAVVAGLLVWLLFFWLPARYTGPATKTAVATSAPAAPGRKIKARLFYVSENGAKLTSVETEVPYGEGATEQARAIMSAQLDAPVPAVPALVSAVPPGTALRALFVTDKGEAFVDFSTEIVTAHTGGSLGELLTVHTIVNALTVNLPVIKTVQILVDGKQVDSLAGHVDLGHPLTQNLSLVE